MAHSPADMIGISESDNTENAQDKTEPSPKRPRSEQNESAQVPQVSMDTTEGNPSLPSTSTDSGASTSYDGPTQELDGKIYYTEIKVNAFKKIAYRDVEPAIGYQQTSAIMGELLAETVTKLIEGSEKDDGLFATYNIFPDLGTRNALFNSLANALRISDTEGEQRKDGDRRSRTRDFRIVVPVSKISLSDIFAPVEKSKPEQINFWMKGNPYGFTSKFPNSLKDTGATVPAQERKSVNFHTRSGTEILIPALKREYVIRSKPVSELPGEVPDIPLTNYRLCVSHEALSSIREQVKERCIALQRIREGEKEHKDRKTAERRAMGSFTSKIEQVTSAASRIQQRINPTTRTNRSSEMATAYGAQITGNKRSRHRNTNLNNQTLDSLASGLGQMLNRFLMCDSPTSGPGIYSSFTSTINRILNKSQSVTKGVREGIKATLQEVKKGIETEATFKQTQRESSSKLKDICTLCFNLAAQDTAPSADQGCLLPNAFGLIWKFPRRYIIEEKDGKKHAKPEEPYHTYILNILDLHFKQLEIATFPFLTTGYMPRQAYCYYHTMAAFGLENASADAVDYCLGTKFAELDFPFQSEPVASGAFGYSRCVGSYPMLGIGSSAYIGMYPRGGRQQTIDRTIPTARVQIDTRGLNGSVLNQASLLRQDGEAETLKDAIAKAKEDRNMGPISVVTTRWIVRATGAEDAPGPDFARNWKNIGAFRTMSYKESDVATAADSLKMIAFGAGLNTSTSGVKGDNSLYMNPPKAFDGTP